MFIVTDANSVRHVSWSFIFFVLTFGWPCISVYLSQYLTYVMHKICFTVSFISCLYMFRARVLIIRRLKLHYTASGIITPSFISCLYMFRAHVLIIRRSKLHYTASGIITPSFISCLYMFRAHVLIIRRSKLQYTASGIITPIFVHQVG